jgi:hypothetical protein
VATNTSVHELIASWADRAERARAALAEMQGSSAQMLAFTRPDVQRIQAVRAALDEHLRVLRRINTGPTTGEWPAPGSGDPGAA